MIARLGLLRSCVCGGMWALESRSTTAAAGNSAGQMGSTSTAASSSSTPAMQQELARTPGLMQGS